MTRQRLTSLRKRVFSCLKLDFRDIQPFSQPQTANSEPHAVRSPNRTRFGCGLDPKPNRNRTVADNTAVGGARERRGTAGAAWGEQQSMEVEAKWAGV